MTRTSIFILLGCAALGACNNNQAQQGPNKIRVTSQEQEQLHEPAPVEERRDAGAKAA